MKQKRIFRHIGWLAVRAVLLSVTLLGTGCGDDAGEWQSMKVRMVRHNLISFNNAQSFVAYAQDAASQRMRAEVELQRAQDIAWLTTEPALRDMPTANADVDYAEDMDSSSSDAKGDDAGGTAGHSTTNTQEAGVDEADIVKTDGQYIYALSGGKLVIVKTQEGVLTKSGSIDVGGFAREMFINGNVVAVFSNRAEADVPEEMRYPMNDNANLYNIKYDDMSVDDVAMPDSDPGTGKAYCDEYGCAGNTYLQLALVDVSNPSAPSLIRTMIYGGQYVTSRMVNGVARLVLDTPLYNLSMTWDYGDNPDWSTEQGLNTAYANVIRENETAFSALTMKDIVPGKWDSKTNAVTLLVNPENITAPQTPNGVGLQTIVSIDLNSPMADSTQEGVFSQRGIVYASTESLYLTSARDWVSLAMESGLWSGYENQTTGIHKFDISGNTLDVPWLATGTVDGRLLNQFSMGEKDGYLRVASTTGDFWWGDAGNTLDNHVFVLGQAGTMLKQIGHISGLGAGEEIYAVRFMGDKAFIVTFFQSDPLFTIDLSDPANPTKLGEWVGPGYSTYLHPYGDNLLIALGEEDWQPTISLYNIADFFNPVLVQRIPLGTDAWSAALYDHKAFTFNPETGFLALPFSGWTDGFQTGILTYKISEGGIEPRGTLNMATEDDSYYSEALRSMYIDEFLYGMSRCSIGSAPIDSPESITSSVALFDGENCAGDLYPYWY
ncbi:MAG: beta-propeller domain-containing protein [Deltaproteobacteria bacterium]|nr:beta-propeller domain-containing protein [Deltaproteobacteria bacterium]